MIYEDDVVAIISEFFKDLVDERFEAVRESALELLYKVGEVPVFWGLQCACNRQSCQN